MKCLITLFFDKNFVRFVLVGIVNTLFGTGIMFLFYNVFNLGYWVSSFSNYFFGSILSYFLNKYFTFRTKEKSWREIVVWVVNISVCYLIAYGVAKPLMLWFLAECSQVVQENIAMLVGMCLFVSLNYIGQRIIVFKKKN